MLFVTYQPFDFNRYCAESHIGNTVTILEKAPFTDKWVVGAYNADGHWEQWTSHVDELDGFDGV